MAINVVWHKKNKIPDYFKKYKGKKSVSKIKAIWHEAYTKGCNCR